MPPLRRRCDSQACGAVMYDFAKDSPPDREAITARFARMRDANLRMRLEAARELMRSSNGKRGAYRRSWRKPRSSAAWKSRDQFWMRRLNSNASATPNLQSISAVGSARKVVSPGS